MIKLIFTPCDIAVLGEALALRYGDIDYKRKKVRIDEKGFWRGGKLEITDRMKSEAGEREVPLIDDLSKILPIGPKDALIFNMPGRTALDRNLAKWRKRAGIHSTLHQLRHGFCTFLFEAGVDEKTAQYYMGHSSIEMTRDLYTHLREKQIRENDERLNNYLKGEKTNDGGPTAASL